LKRLIASLLLVLATTGCYRVNTDLTVTANDRVSGSATIAVDNRVLNTEGLKFTTTRGWLTETPGLASRKFEDGAFTGTTYLLDNVPIDKLATRKSENYWLTIKRNGELIEVAGIIDTSKLVSPDSVSDAQFNMAKATSQILIRITLPGTVTYSTGKIDGNTVTFSGHLGEKVVIGAQATSKPDVINWPLIGTVVTVVLLLGSGFVLYFVLKKRKPLYTA
jgi:hypothetical protein